MSTVWFALFIITFFYMLYNRFQYNELKNEISKLKENSEPDYSDFKYSNRSTEEKKKKSDGSFAAREVLGLTDNEPITQAHIAKLQERKIDSDLLKPDLENASKDSPFYNKKIVITGEFDSFSRKEVAQLLYSLGADINTALSKKTNYLLVGENPGPSKMKKADALIDQETGLRILSEEDLLNMIEK